MSKYLDSPGITHLWERMKVYVTGLGFYTKPSTGIPASDIANGVIPDALIQADWNQAVTTATDYIKNKPNIITDTYGHTSIGNNNISITGGSVTITDSKNSILLDNAGDNGIQITANDGSDGTISLTASSTISINTTGNNKAYYNSKEIATKSDIPTVYAWALAATKPSYTAADVGAVPTTRTVNGKALSADISLTASDVGALPSSTVIPAAQVNSDWNAVSGVAQILNKPTIPTITFRQW